MANIVNSGDGANITAEVTVTQGNDNLTVIDAAHKAARDFVDKEWAAEAARRGVERGIAAERAHMVADSQERLESSIRAARLSRTRRAE